MGSSSSRGKSGHKVSTWQQNTNSTSDEDVYRQSQNRPNITRRYNGEETRKKPQGGIELVSPNTEQNRPKQNHRHRHSYYSEDLKSKGLPNNSRPKSVGCFAMIPEQLTLKGPPPRHRAGYSQQEYRNTRSNDVAEALACVGNGRPGISRESKIIILASLVPTLVEGPRRPAIFLILKPESDSNSDDNDDLVHSIAEACSNVYNADRKISSPMISLSHRDFAEETVKETIDRIGNSMKNEGLKVLVIKDIDTIKTPRFFTFLHYHCDNDYAPFKNVAFFFSATIPSKRVKESQSPNVVVDEIRNDIFDRAWPQLEEDTRKPLLARIGANTIIVQIDIKAAT